MREEEEWKDKWKPLKALEWWNQVTGTRGRGVEVTLKGPTILLCLLGVILKRWLKVHNLILQSWAFSNQTITTLTPANRMIHDLSFANIKNQEIYCSSVQHLLMMDFLFFFLFHAIPHCFQWYIKGMWTTKFLLWIKWTTFTWYTTKWAQFMWQSKPQYWY